MATSWDEIEFAIQERAMRDRAFRSELIADPAAVVNRELAAAGHSDGLPDHLDVAVVDQPANSVRIVLPPLLDDAETADDDECSKDPRRSSLTCGGGRPCSTLW
jgi:hypothetical protein